MFIGCSTPAANGGLFERVVGTGAVVQRRRGVDTPETSLEGNSTVGNCVFQVFTGDSGLRTVVGHCTALAATMCDVEKAPELSIGVVAFNLDGTMEALDKFLPVEEALSSGESRSRLGGSFFTRTSLAFHNFSSLPANSNGAMSTAAAPANRSRK